MSEVSVIGLGAMGAAIANAFINAGRDVTVWNRSAGRLGPFRETAANCAASFDAALGASAAVVVCIDDYAATAALFDPPDTAALLDGRTLVQFSTGTPEEARRAESRVRQYGADYLDGAILAYPREVGHDGLIALAGSEGAYRRHAGLLAALSSDIRYLGPSVGAAAALDVAVLSYYVCAHLGLVHGALVCEAEDVSPERMTEVIVDSLPSDVEELRHLGRALKSRQFGDPGASIGTYSGVLDRIRVQAADAGIDDRIPAFADRLYKEAVAGGLADEEVVALVKLLGR